MSVIFQESFEIRFNNIVRCMTGQEWNERVAVWRKLNLITKDEFDTYFGMYGSVPGMWDYHLQCAFPNSMHAFYAFNQVHFVEWIRHVQKTWPKFYDMLIKSIDGDSEVRTPKRMNAQVKVIEEQEQEPQRFPIETKSYTPRRAFQFNFGKMNNAPETASQINDDTNGDSDSDSDSSFLIPPPYITPLSVTVETPRSIPSPSSSTRRNNYRSLKPLHQILTNPYVRSMTGGTWTNLYCSVLSCNVGNPSSDEKLSDWIMTKYFWPYGAEAGVWHHDTITSWYNDMIEFEEHFPLKFAYFSRMMDSRFSDEFVDAVFCKKEETAK